MVLHPRSSWVSRFVVLLLLCFGCAATAPLAGGTTQAPSALVYPTNPAVYIRGSAIPYNTPTCGGGVVQSYTVTPALPAGLSLYPPNGTIYGTPSTVSPTTTYTITASNDAGSTTASVTITVNDLVPSNLVYPTNQAVYIRGTAIANNTPTCGGGLVQSYTVNPALPAGLSLYPPNGMIYGTPSAVSPATTYTITASNAAGSTTTSVIITVNDTSTTASATSSITSVSVSPTTLTLNPSAQSSFAATVAGTGTYSYGVTWSCLLGTITSGGLYTAPSTAGNDTVTATSVQDGTRKGTSSVTVSSSGSVSGSVPAGTSVKSSPYNAYGDGVHDDTAAINACIAAVAGTGGTVVVPAGTYMVNPTANGWGYGIGMGSNMTLYLSSGATIQAITSNLPNYAIVGFPNVNHSTLTGPGMISGDRATHTGAVGESGHGVYINDGSYDIALSGFTVNNCYGDGVYVYTTSDPSDITVSGILSDNNRRQGMSIIGVAGGVSGGMTVTNSTFSNTNGTGPECGIDIEPNASQSVDGVNISGCAFTGNHGGGFQEGGGPTTNITNTVFTGNIVTANGFGTRSSSDASTPSGILVSQCLGSSSLTTGPKITNNIITGNNGQGIALDWQNYATVSWNTITTTQNFGTTYAAGGAIYLFDSDYNTITGNACNNNVGPGVWYVGSSTDTHNTLTPNTFSGNGGANYPAPTY